MKHFLDDVISSEVDMDGYILSIEKLIDKNNPYSSIKNDIEEHFVYWPYNKGCGSFSQFRKEIGVCSIIQKAECRTVNISREEFVFYLEYAINIIQIPKFSGFFNPLLQDTTKVSRVIFNAISDIGCEIISKNNGYYLVDKNGKISVATKVVNDTYNLDKDLYLFTHSSIKDDLVKKADILCRAYKYIESIRTKANQYGYSNMYDDISKMMDALDIRHYPNKKATETLNGMSKEELLEWYDQLFELCVSLIILVDYSSKRKDIKELKGKLG